MNGIILVKKEKDYTSFDVVAIMRKMLGTKKVGHLGTLDPMATGVLPILVGKGTKLGQYLSADKEYEADFRFGIISDTEDIWGELSIVNEEPPTDAELKAVLKNFEGKQNQIPPMYSAKKVKGVKLYTLARQGIEVERKAKEIEIYSIDYLGKISPTDFKIRVACSEGTYIRTLIKDIGECLGRHAVMTGLVRTKSHSFSLENSKTISELKSDFESDTANFPIISMEEALLGYDRVNIPVKEKERFLNGVKLSLSKIKEIPDSLFCRVYAGDEFLGLGEIRKNASELKVALHNKDGETLEKR